VATIKNPMKPENSKESKTQKQPSAPYIPVALGEIGRQIRLSMPQRTSEEANAHADMVAQFRKEQAALREGRAQS